MRMKSVDEFFSGGRWTPFLDCDHTLFNSNLTAQWDQHGHTPLHNFIAQPVSTIVHPRYAQSRLVSFAKL